MQTPPSDVRPGKTPDVHYTRNHSGGESLPLAVEYYGSDMQFATLSCMLPALIAPMLPDASRAAQVILHCQRIAALLGNVATQGMKKER